MNTKLLLLSATTVLCGSGCTATLQPDGTLHTHYYAPVVVEEPVMVAPAPVVVVERPAPIPPARPARLFPLFVSYKSPARLAPRPLRSPRVMPDISRSYPTKKPIKAEPGRNNPNSHKPGSKK